MWTRLAARMRAFFQSPALDEDFDQEMESHLAMLAEDNVRRGMTPQEARRQARLRLGGRTQLGEAHREHRGLPALETLLQDLRYAARAMRRAIEKANSHGIGVVGVRNANSYTSAKYYALLAAKAGMIGMSKALAAEVASRAITVNCIAPGFIASPMTDALDARRREGLLASVPMGRLGAGSDIGAAAVYLASAEAAYVTGQTLHVNGGMAMI